LIEADRQDRHFSNAMLLVSIRRGKVALSSNRSANLGGDLSSEAEGLHWGRPGLCKWPLGVSFVIMQLNKTG
jgi:hypothetical protein